MSESKLTQNVSPRRGLLIGGGYFSDFHLDAWRRMDSASIVCVCDQNAAKAEQAAAKHGISDFNNSVDEALTRTDIDFIDIATGPTGRLDLVRKVIRRGLPIICQKPLANDFKDAVVIIDLANASDVQFMVHENFRFQPWYREIKRLLDSSVIGAKLHTITMVTRMGDGWGDDAYLSRQPYFRTMKRMLVQETGIHFLDTFRYLGGEAASCSAVLRRLNDAVVGEDAGVVTLQLASGAMATWDANRYNESSSKNPRYTFGEMSIEADGGSLRLGLDGRIHIHPLGGPQYEHPYSPSTHGFAGDCVLACQRHFMDVLDGSVKCETSPSEYLKSLRLVEAAYESDQRGRPIELRRRPVVMMRPATVSKSRRRVIDLSLPVSTAMPGVDIASCKTIDADGWNATTLTLYSHSGTHMDAPKHFVPDGLSLQQQDLSVCCGSARLVDLPETDPRHLITVDDVLGSIGEVYPGDRLLFRTDWHHRFGTPAYRDELPRISLALAHWLVDRQVVLIGVEPPSVANVNDRAELTEVHQTLFRGGVVIVEGLANLDQLARRDQSQAGGFEFIALPLNIVGGDGCPVRAIAIVDDVVGGDLDADGDKAES